MGTKEKEESTTKPTENESHGISFYIKNFIYKLYITFYGVRSQYYFIDLM